MDLSFLFLYLLIFLLIVIGIFATGGTCRD